MASGIPFSLAVFLNPLHLSEAEVAKPAGNGKGIQVWAVSGTHWACVYTLEVEILPEEKYSTTALFLCLPKHTEMDQLKM